MARTATEPNTVTTDSQNKDIQDNTTAGAQSDQAQPKTEGASENSKPATTNAPLAPPPKPGQNPSETPDYFNAAHNGNHFSLEPNPFEQSFGNPAAETPNKFGGLPSVASLTSPAPVGPGGTPNWQGSLRSGPLSPAMLPGPTGSNGYFDQEFRGSFPTPNESSLRTGLTPGGGGSMFPAPSPNSQAIFNSMQSGGATPGTIDFHRTAMNAAARNKVDANQPNLGNSQQPVKQEYQPAGQQQQQQQQQQGQQDPFANQPESDAVNSLYMLANTGNRNANQFAVPPQPQHNMNQNMNQMQHQHQQHRGNKQSIGSMSGSGMGEDFDHSDNDDHKTNSSRAKGKKGPNSKGGASNGRRKADETPSKTPANKRSKVNSGSANEAMDDDDDSDPGPEPTHHANGKKMTDEEKRKNFLERNRVAALKCRQRKKQWLANLQTKVEIFTSENDALSAQCTQLREEVVNLKTLLLAHKDCQVSHQQGLGGANMAQVMGDFNPPHPYGMHMPNGSMMGMQSGPGMQRT